jgi:hypothetical protein
MAVSAASSRLQPCKQALFCARFLRFSTASNTNGFYEWKSVQEGL